MIPNFLVLAGSAFIPFAVAFAWFHPSLFGGDNWTKTAGLTDEQSSKPVKPLKMVLSILLNFFIAVGLFNVCVHASGVFGLISADMEALNSGTAAAFLAEYGTAHTTFGHGVIHGIFSGVLMFALPILGYVTIFERKSTRYFFINLGFWTISLALMGGVISKWGWVFVA